MSRGINRSTQSGKPYNWTAQEIETLCSLHATTRVRDLVPIIGRSKHSIVGKMRLMKLRSFDSLLWTPEQLAAIRSALPGTLARNLARKIGRSTKAVFHKAQELGVALTKNAPWTAEQEALLREKAATMDCAEIAALIGRSPRGVRSKADLLGIKVKPSDRPRSGKHPCAPRAPKPDNVRSPIALAPKRKQIEVSRIEWCPECYSPVSNWAEHYERMGHRRRA